MPRKIRCDSGKKRSRPYPKRRTTVDMGLKPWMTVRAKKAAAVMVENRRIRDRRRLDAEREEAQRRQIAAENHARDPLVQLYRSEKPAADARRKAEERAILADAKAAYDRLYADLEQRRKGGRPKSKGDAASIGKSAFVCGNARARGRSA